MAQRKALGKGISSIIPSQPPPGTRRKKAKTGAKKIEAEDDAAAGMLRMMPIGQLAPNPDQPRKRFDPEHLEELSASIRDRGILQPIVVTKAQEGDSYLIIAGERRWRASRQAGLTEVPVVIREAAGSEIVELALIENIQRQDLDPLDEAEAYKRLLDDYGYTQEELARKMAMSRSAVANSLRLLNLSAEVKELVAAGALTAGHARALLPLEPEAQLTLARTILARGLNVREAEALVRDRKGPGKPAKSSRAKSEPSSQVRHLSEELQRALGTKVAIRDKGKKGQIIIDYYSYEDLDRLIQQLTELRNSGSRKR